MKLLPILLLVTSPALPATGSEPIDWQAALQAGNYEEARVACREATTSEESVIAAEGFKCLANLALQGKSRVQLQGDETGGGVLREGYDGDAVDNALAFLEKAMEQQPNDLSIHQGRMHLLLVASRYDETPAALEDSMTHLGEKPPVGMWLSYSGYFWDDRVFSPGIAFLKKLETWYPDNYEIIGNLGAFNAQLGNLEEALKYSRQALALRPDSALDAANVARILYYLEDWDAADTAYQEAIKLGEQSGWQNVPKTILCNYAEMLAEKMNQPERACALEVDNCEASVAACE